MKREHDRYSLGTVSLTGRVAVVSCAAGLQMGK
jgi:hypothetical protein